MCPWDLVPFFCEAGWGRVTSTLVGWPVLRAEGDPCMETWGEVSVTTIVWGKGRRWGVGRRKRKGRDGSRREERGYEGGRDRG